MMVCRYIAMSQYARLAAAECAEWHRADFLLRSRAVGSGTSSEGLHGVAHCVTRSADDWTTSCCGAWVRAHTQSVRKCRFCAEDTRDAAIVCKHCRRELIPRRMAASTAPALSIGAGPLWMKVGGGLLLLLILRGLWLSNHMTPVDSSKARAVVQKKAS